MILIVLKLIYNFTINTKKTLGFLTKQNVKKTDQP